MTSVDCREIREAFVNGAVPSGAEVDDHARGCPHCAALLGDDGRLGRSLADQASTKLPATNELWGELERAVQAEVGPRAFLRSRPTGQRLAVAMLAALLLAAFGAFGLRGDWAQTRFSVLGWGIVSAVVVLACLAARLRSRGRPPMPAIASIAIGVFGLGLPLLYAFAHSSNLALESEPAFFARTIGCFVYGTMIALPLLVLLWAFERGEAFGATTAWLAGAAAGLVGNLALLLHCSILDFGHLLLGHATVGVALVAALISVGRVRQRAATSRARRFERQ